MTLKKVYQGDLVRVAARNVLNEERLVAWRSRYAEHQSKQQTTSSSKELACIDNEALAPSVLTMAH